MHRRKSIAGYAALLVCLAGSELARGEDWTKTVSVCVQQQNFVCAKSAVDQELQSNPHDVDALIWRARLLGWSGNYADAERGYGDVLAISPGNGDALLGLADVEFWDRKYSDALNALDRAEKEGVPHEEIASRRDKVVRAQQADAAPAVNPAVPSAQSDDASPVNSETHHELRVGSDTDTFNFTGPANAETLSLASNWSRRFSTNFGMVLTQRFGETAEQANAGITFRITRHYWITGSGGFANPQDVVARKQSSVEFGTAHAFSFGLIKGSELYLQQRNFWFTGTTVSSFGATNLFYLPRDWSLTVSATAARTYVTGAGAAWEPSGFGRLAFPLAHPLQGQLLYAVGAENYANADQIGRFAARSIGGGVRYRFARVQDVSILLVAQDRSQAKSQFSIGASYGIHF